MVWPYSIRHTFSQHVARQRSSYVYYVIMFSVFLPLFLLFFIGWLIPHAGLPAWSAAFICIASITQYACTFIPETVGWKRRWHRILATTSAFGLIPPIIILAIFSHIYEVRLISVLSVIVMFVMPIIFLQPKVLKRFGESYLIQVAYYGAFFVPVLVAAYFA